MPRAQIPDPVFLDLDRSAFITFVVLCFLYSNPGKGIPDLSKYRNGRGRNDILRWYWDHVAPTAQNDMRHIAPPRNYCRSYQYKIKIKIPRKSKRTCTPGIGN